MEPGAGRLKWEGLLFCCNHFQKYIHSFPKRALYSILLKCLIGKKGLYILLPWGRWATCNLLRTLNPTFATCRARTSDTTKQGQPTLKPNIGCDSKPRCSKGYVSFSSHQNPLNTPKKGREDQRLIVLSSLIPSPFCSLSPLYLFFLGTFGILSLQVMTIDVARVTSHQWSSCLFLSLGC